MGTWIMYFSEDRRTDLQDASGKVLRPQGISYVHPKVVRRFARESSGCQFMQKKKHTDIGKCV